MKSIVPLLTAAACLMIGVGAANVWSNGFAQDRPAMDHVDPERPRLMGRNCIGEDGSMEPLIFADEEDQFPGACKEIVALEYARG